MFRIIKAFGAHYRCCAGWVGGTPTASITPRPPMRARLDTDVCEAMTSAYVEDDPLVNTYYEELVLEFQQISTSPGCKAIEQFNCEIVINNLSGWLTDGSVTTNLFSNYVRWVFFFQRTNWELPSILPLKPSITVDNQPVY